MVHKELPWRGEHFGIIKDVRALTYEIEQLQRNGYERALGLAAVTASLMEICDINSGDPVAVLSEATAQSVRELRGVVDETSEFRRQMAVAQAERTRPYSLQSYEKFGQLVDGLSAQAYFLYARQYGASPDFLRRQPGVCYSISHLMQQALRKKGVETERMWWYENGENHHFLRTTNVPDETFVIDPTWQQMLPKDADYESKPNLLIAPIGALDFALEVHGLPHEKWSIWQTARVDQNEDPSKWELQLKAIFADDPWLPAALDVPFDI